MTVEELIQELKKFEPKLIVCLSDWNEGYTIPSESEAGILEVVNARYRDEHGEKKHGQFLRIGGGW